MWNGVIHRRANLGRTSVREICRLSTTGLSWYFTGGVKRRRPPIPAEGEKDITIRWGCTAPVTTRLVLNSVEAIHRVNDKGGFRRTMNEHPGMMPRTWYAEDIGDIDQYPVVVRPRVHSRGRFIWRANTREELDNVIQTNRARLGNDFYISSFFDKTHEFRVCIVQGRAVWVANKTPDNPGALAWNVAQGGRFDNVRWDQWPLKVVKLACDIFPHTGLDFGGVDIMWDERTRTATVVEVNSAMSVTSPYRQEATAKAFDWIMNREDKNRIGITEERGGYKKFIHPALTEEAILVGANNE